MRRTVASTEAASALASVVLPTPGTSSIRRWPSASSTTSASRTTSSLPWTTRPMLAAIPAPTAATSTDGPAAPSAVRVASVTSPPYVAGGLCGRPAPRRPTAPHHEGGDRPVTCALAPLGPHRAAGGGGRSRHGDEWCPVGASGLLCRPVGRQGPARGRCG